MDILGLDAHRYHPMLLLALGKPVDDCRLALVPESGETTYWRDASHVHHVPKRSLEDVLIAKR